MKPYKKYFAVLLTAVVMFTVCACTKSDDPDSPYYSLTERTDSAEGESVTNESGEYIADDTGAGTQSAAVSNENGTVGTVQSTDSDGNTVFVNSTTAYTTAIKAGTTAPKKTTAKSTTTKAGVTTTTTKAPTATTASPGGNSGGGLVTLTTTTKATGTTTTKPSSTTPTTNVPGITLPNTGIPGIDAEVLRINNSNYPPLNNVPFEEFGIAGADKTSLQSNSSSWKSYVVTVKIVNGSSYGITVYGLKDSGTGKNGVYIGKSGEADIGVPASSTSYANFYVLVNDSSLAESVVLNTVKESALELRYAPTIGYDDTEPTNFQYISLK